MRASRDFLNHELAGLWPGATLISDPDALDPTNLCTITGAKDGTQPIVNVVTNVNAGPVQRYTQIHPGTLQYRRRPDESGYVNMAIAGDWTRNGLEIGCAEGAIVSGRRAAGVVAGRSFRLLGAWDHHE